MTKHQKPMEKDRPTVYLDEREEFIKKHKKDMIEKEANKMVKDNSELDNRTTQKYCPYCGSKMYSEFRCQNCHKVS